MSALFLETSALLRMLFQEEGAEKAEERIGTSTRLLASRLIRVEAERAILRFGLDHPREAKRLQDLQRELKAFWPKVDFIEITREVCDLAGRTAPESRLRTLDAIHLATFHRLREIDPSLEIVTFDKRILAEL